MQPNEKLPCEEVEKELVVFKGSDLSQSLKETFSSCDDDLCLIIMLGMIGIGVGGYIVGETVTFVDDTLRWKEKPEECISKQQNFYEDEI